MGYSTDGREEQHCETFFFFFTKNGSSKQLREYWIYAFPTSDDKAWFPYRALNIMYVILLSLLSSARKTPTDWNLACDAAVSR